MVNHGLRHRMLRGGSWFGLDLPNGPRSACRCHARPDMTYGSTGGFRVVCFHQAGHALQLEELADG